MNPNIRTGLVVGTAAAINVSLGFVPDYVKVVNVTDGNIMHEWWKGMTDGHAIQTTNSDLTQLSRITANGISAYDGASAVDAPGFTIGSVVSASGDDLYYIAVRDGAMAD